MESLNEKQCYRPFVIELTAIEIAGKDRGAREKLLEAARMENERLERVSEMLAAKEQPDPVPPVNASANGAAQEAAAA